MDLYQLKAFHLFGQVKSFSETARRMHLTQSAVSHAIRKLEDTVGLRLVEREARRFELTRAGKDLWDSCAVVFHELELAREKLARHQKQAILELYVGSPVEFGTTILLKHMKSFLDTHSGIRIDYLFSHNLDKPLQTGEVDFIIDCREHAGPDIARIELFQELYAVVAAPEFIHEHRLVHPADLERVPLLSLDKDGAWWRNFTATFGDAPPPLRQFVQITHIRGLINGAIAGLGVSFVPRYTVIRELQEGRLQDPFPEIKPLADQFCIFIRKEKLALQKNRQLVDYLRSLHPEEFGSGSAGEPAVPRFSGDFRSGPAAGATSSRRPGGHPRSGGPPSPASRRG